VEDKDIPWIGNASLKFLTETDRVGSFGDAGCVDLGRGTLGCIYVSIIVQNGLLVGRGEAFSGTLLHLVGLLVRSAHPTGGLPDRLVHSPNVL